MWHERWQHYSDTDRAAAEAIQAWRKRQGYTLSDLGRMVGYARSSNPSSNISTLLNGHYGPCAGELLAQLCAIAGLTEIYPPDVTRAAHIAVTGRPPEVAPGAPVTPRAVVRDRILGLLARRHASGQKPLPLGELAVIPGDPAEVHAALDELMYERRVLGAVVTKGSAPPMQVIYPAGLVPHGKPGRKPKPRMLP